MNKPSSLAQLLLVVALFVGATVSTALGQNPGATPQPQQPEEDEVVRISTNLVQVDAVVTDKNGRQVTDLTSADFEIYEDGKRQEITNLSYVSITSPGTERAAAPPDPSGQRAPAPPVRLRPTEVRRTIALVVDDLQLSFESTYYVRRMLKKFVDEQMQPGDLVAIIRTGSGIGALQQFTSDKRQLYAAIERVRWNMRGGGGATPFAPITQDPIASSSSESDEEDSDDTGIGSARGASDEVNALRSEIFSVGTLGALNYIVRGLKELPGRKSVLLISDGFRLFNKGDDSGRVLEALRRLTDLANRASVVIYTMDARGLQTLGLTAADDVSAMTAQQVEAQLTSRREELFDTQSGLIYLARQTGGFNVRNTNDLSEGVTRVLEDQKGYYLIGYRPNEDTFDPRTGQRRFHNITVKVKRSNLGVRSRTGFYGVTDETVVPLRRTRAEQLLGALATPFNADAIDLRLTSLFGNDARAGSFMRSMLYIDARDLTFTKEADGWHQTVMDVMALTFGDEGQVLDQLNKTQTIRVRGETYQRVLRNGLVYFLNVPVQKAGAYQLRIAVRDAATERVGSASQFIEVPNLTKKRLTLSGLVVNGYDPKAGANRIAAGTASNTGTSSNTGTASSAGTASNAGAATNATAPANATPTTAVAATPSAAAGSVAEGASQEPDAQASAAVRRFRPEMVMQFAYVIYNAQLDKTTRRPQIQTQLRLFRDGRLIFTGKTQPLNMTHQTDLARLVAGGGLQLGSDMTPGEYVLQVIVTDLLAKPKERTTTQWIDFEITK